MNQNLPDIIRENKDLQKVLLEQEGGIMKFWAEHLDARGPELFKNYQDQCDAKFFENHEWDFGMTLSRDEMRCKALGRDHIESELGYLTDLIKAMSNIEPMLSNLIITYVEKYLSYAYNEKYKRNFPNGMTPKDLYEEVLGLFRTGGLANDCMKILIIEHNSPGIVEKTSWYRNTMFYVRMKSSILGNWRVEPVLRQAVAEMLDGKTSEDCRYLAVKMMKEVKAFSQMLYSKRTMGVTYLGFGIDEIEVDKEWLRDVASHAVLNEHNKRKKSARYYFSDFVSLLMQIGRIWAAQLLANHSVDMHELEVETDCILKPVKKGDYDYYVDRLIGDSSLSQRVVVDEDHARKLLSKIKHLDTIAAENQTEEKKQNMDAQMKQTDTIRHQDSPPPYSHDDASPLLHQSPEEKNVHLSEKLNIGDAPQYFKKAIEKKWIEVNDEKYRWIGYKSKNGTPNATAWAYFCDKAYGYNVLLKNDISLPVDELEELFNMPKGTIYKSNFRIAQIKNTPDWKVDIDTFFT